MSRVRILLADDHESLLARVVQLLETDAEVVGTAGDGRATIEAVELLKPDVLVLDITMPRLNGIEVARALKKSGSSTKIIFLTVHEEAVYARAAMKAGGSAFVVKSRLGTDLMPAIESSLEGKRFISPSVPLKA